MREHWQDDIRGDPMLTQYVYRSQQFEYFSNWAGLSL